MGERNMTYVTTHIFIQVPLASKIAHEDVVFVLKGSPKLLQIMLR